MGWSGLERNKLDYILTDLLPVEISELFSFSQLYTFLLKKENQKILDALIQEKTKAVGGKGKKLFPSAVTTQLICDFLEQRSPSGNKPEESLFNWKGIKNFADQITYRTYQRTVFKRYRKNTYGLYASLD